MVRRGPWALPGNVNKQQLEKSAVSKRKISQDYIEGPKMLKYLLFEFWLFILSRSQGYKTFLCSDSSAETKI